MDRCKLFHERFQAMMIRKDKELENYFNEKKISLEFMTTYTPEFSRIRQQFIKDKIDYYNREMKTLLDVIRTECPP